MPQDAPKPGHRFRDERPVGGAVATYMVYEANRFVIEMGADVPITTTKSTYGSPLWSAHAD